MPPGNDLVLVLDVSRSMGAADAVPDRLGAAIEAAGSLIASPGDEGGDRVAVVAFAGRGVLRCPLTGNLGAAADTLKLLRPGGVRPGGTDLGAGLDAAFDAFDDGDHAGGRSVVVFSDGEDLVGRWPAAVERLRARGVVVHTVAVGDREVGQTVPSVPGEPSEPVRYHGALVLSRRSDEALAAVSRATGGAFVPLGTASVDLGTLYRTRIEPAARDARKPRPVQARVERFPLFLLAALALILTAVGTGRPVGAFLRGGGLVLSIALAGAVPAGGPAGSVARGRVAYAAGRYGDALTSFRDALRLAPGEPAASYDVAATCFQLRRYDEARSLYLAARERAGPVLRVKIDYALGNTAVAAGDLNRAAGHYDACLGSEAAGEGLDRVRRDAAVNLRFVLEQTRRAEATAGSETRAKQKGPQGRPGRGEPGGGAEPPPSSGVGSQKTDGARGETRSGARGTGGAGGSGHAAPRAGSPEEQLAGALNDVREARRMRIEEADPEDERDDRKDW